MNKGVIFLAGLLVGAIGGSVGTYFVVKNKIADEAAEEIEAYAEHCREKIENIKTKFSGEDFSEEVQEDIPEPKAADDYSNNEGVKKYHQHVSKDNLDSANSYKEEVKAVTEGEKALKREEAGVPVAKKTYIISEDQYTTEATMYDKITLEFYCGDDQIVIMDTEELIEQHFNLGREDIIPAEAWRYGQDNVDKPLFVRNDDLACDFEILTYDRSLHDEMGESEEIE